MAQKHVIKRIIESDTIEVTKTDPRTGVQYTEKKTILKYVFGIFSPTFSGARVCTAIVEGTYTDAKQMLKAGRTESGNTFKGFKKLKSKDA